MDKSHILHIDRPTAADHTALLDILNAFSDSRAGDRDWPDHDLCLAIKDPDGAIAGGLWGRFYYDWLFIELIFVPEDRRGQDLGSTLLALAEAQARAWGAIGVWLDTFTFQACGFYEKKGYEIFGEISDYPAPHKRLFLSKRLDPSAPLAVAHPAIEQIQDPQPQHREAIDAVLTRFNDVEIGGGPWPDADLALVMKDAGGAIIGGLWGRSYYHWLFVDALFVPESLRGQRVGTELLNLGEAEARRRGCVGVWLDTFAFQAPEFYPQHGYVPFGRIDAYPAPHDRVFFAKRL